VRELQVLEVEGVEEGFMEGLSPKKDDLQILSM
jgi:hypothetical protein